MQYFLEQLWEWVKTILFLFVVFVGIIVFAYLGIEAAKWIITTLLPWL